MKRFAVLAGVTVALTLGTSEAGAQMAQWVPPACKLNTKHFLVNSAQLYLKNATQAKNPDQRQTNLKDAGRVLHEAITTGGQADNPAVWYMYGRYYLLTDSLVAADSSFRKAEKAQPDCADDIALQRRSAWVPHVQAAAEALNKNDYATAKASFRQANAIYQGDPIGFYYLANVFINENQIDSALTYFRKTVEYSDKSDTSQTETYETSIFNMGRLFHQQQQWDSAAAWYQRYRQEKPGDTQALTGLAVVYASAGDTARANKLYDEILMNADNVPALDLFSAGIQLFRDGRYPRAAQAFQAVLKKNPYYRDALYNLSSTYLSMGSSRDTTLSQAQKDAMAKQVGQQMLPITQRMVQIDGQNRNTLRMLAVAYQYLGDQDATLKALEAAESLPFEVSVQVFQPTQTGHEITGTVNGLMGQRVQQFRDSIAADSLRLDNVQKSVRTGKDPKTGKIIPPAIKDALAKQQPVLEKRVADLHTELQRMMTVAVPPITFEFIDAQGQVIASQTVPAMTLQPTGSQDFSLTANGEGIQGWRYKIGG